MTLRTLTSLAAALVLFFPVLAQAQGAYYIAT